MSRSLWTLAAAAAVVGCDPPSPTRDVPATSDDAEVPVERDRPSTPPFDAGADAGRDAGADAGRDVGMDDGLRDAPSERSLPEEDRGVGSSIGECDPSAHVDCFGGFACEGDGSVRACAHSPYPTCTQAQARAAYEADICCRSRGFQCPSGRCADAPVDARYRACVTARSVMGPNPDRALMRLVCAGALLHAGDRCTAEGCRPAADEPDLALRCDADAGVCVRVARPASAPGLGAPCGPDAPDGSPDRCPRCIPPTAGCPRWRCTQACTLDEDCPAGWDCDVSRECTGVCVPRGRRPSTPSDPCW